ncbi:MAG: DUF5655 domain-containing protein [Pirellulales bacterium]
MGPVFDALRSETLKLGPLVHMSILKSYIAFVYADNHFVDVIPRKRSIRVLLNVARGFLSDPETQCKDISGTFGPFEYEYSLQSLAQIPYCMSLVRQAYERNAAWL